MANPDGSPMAFSTDALPVRHRFDAWREAFALSLARVDIETPDRSRFRASATVHPLATTRLIDFDLGPVSITRTRELLHDGDDGFSLVVCTGGVVRAIGANGESAILRTGAAMLIPHYAAGGTTSDGDTTELTLVIPRATLREALPDPDRVAAGPPAAIGAMALLTGYLGAMNDEADFPSPDFAHVVEGHLLDLLAHAYHPAGARARDGGTGGARVALRKKLLRLLAERYAEPDLDPTGAAATLGISLRSVHNLLEESGRSFSEHLREHRLQAAVRMLRSPRFADWRIIDIALAAGFGDLSYFNRIFRRRFGDTPQAFRPPSPAGA